MVSVCCPLLLSFPHYFFFLLALFLPYLYSHKLGLKAFTSFFYSHPKHVLFCSVAFDTFVLVWYKFEGPTDLAGTSRKVRSCCFMWSHLGYIYKIKSRDFLRSVRQAHHVCQSRWSLFLFPLCLRSFCLALVFPFSALLIKRASRKYRNLRKMIRPRWHFVQRSPKHQSQG